MKDSTRHTLVGLTAIAGIAAFAALVFVFGEMPRWLNDTYTLTIELDTAEGIADGSRVRFVGVDVGAIESVALKDNPAEGVRLLARIDGKYDIPAGSTVGTAGSLLGGTSAVLITPGESATVALPRDGSGKLTGTATSLTTQIASMAGSLGGDLKTQLKKFGVMSDKIGRLADEFTVVGENLNLALKQTSPDAVDSGNADANLISVLARADARLAELKTTLAGINEIVGDEQLIADLKATVANAKDASAGAKLLVDDGRDLAADAKATVNDVRGKVDQLTRRYIAVADDLSKSLARIDGLLATTQEGKGTLGKLFKDPALYDSFTDAANRLDDSLKEFKLLIEKWKAEGLPIQL